MDIKIFCFLFMLIVGCYPVSHIVVGEKKEPIDPSQVIVYSDFPEEYEKIAIIESGSTFSFKDPSLDFTHQKKTDRALQRLKNEAASLGSNGIVINNLSTKTKQNLHISEENVSTKTERSKEINAIAIFVK